MAEVRALRGVRYAPAVVGGLGPLLCPPYDEITPAEQERLYRASPWNAVRLELPRAGPGPAGGGSPYQAAAATLAGWLREGVLLTEAEPAFYLVEEGHGSGAAPRLGLMAGVRLEEYGRGMVLPHEHTRRGPKEDRLRMMEACRANFSPVMALYRQPEGLRALLEAEASRRPPDYTAVGAPGAASHRAWVLSDPALARRVASMVAPHPLYLADGHHRYETALAYRDMERRRTGAAPGAAFDYVLGCLVAMDDPGLHLHSFHRLLSGLDVEGLGRLRGRLGLAFEGDSRAAGAASAEGLDSLLQEVVAAGSAGAPALGLLDLERGRFSLLTLRRDAPLPEPEVPELRRCETWLLHAGVLGPTGMDQGGVEYVHGLEEVASRAAGGLCQVVFLVPPLGMGLFEALVRRGQRLPPKSTYFAPKLPTGLVMASLEGPA